MFGRINGCPRLSFLARSSLRLIPLLLLTPWVQFTHNPNARARSLRLSTAESPSPQQSAGAQNAQEVTPLELGQPVERELSGSQKQAYQVTLAKKQYANFIVEQRGIDVVVRLFGPDGKLIVELDAESRTQGQESLDVVADTAGAYKVEVGTKYKLLPAGRYEIRLAESRAATEKDSSLEEARKLHSQARRVFNAGNYDEAVKLAEKSLSLRESILGPEHPDVSQLLFNLALYYRNAGDVPRAEQLLLRVLATREKALGPEHVNIAPVLHNLAYLYHDSLRDYRSAEPLYQRSLAIKEKTLGADHPQVALTLNNMGLLHWKKSDYVMAENYYQRARAIWEKASGPESQEVANGTHNLGIVYKESGDYTRGEAAYKRALQIWEKALGKEHPRVALALESLGILYRDKGDYVNAEPLLQRALEIEEKTEGVNHPNVANTLVLLARLYEAKGDIARAVELQTRANAIEEKNIALNLLIGSERQKLSYFSQALREEERRISLHVRAAPDDRAARELAATAILQRKGRVLDAMADTVATLRRRLNAQDQTLLDQLKDTTAQVGRLILGGPQGMTLAEHEEKVKALEERREQIESEVSRRSFGLYQPSQPVTLDNVRAAVPLDAALVEFVVYHARDPKIPVERERESPGEARYVVYVIRNQGEVRWAELGAAKEIDANVDKLRQALRDPLRKDVRDLARAVDEKVLRPVRVLLGDTTRLLISPDGELNLIPFEALVDEDGRYAVERYSFTYLTSGRDLLRMQVARGSKSKPLVVANPSFGAPAAELLAATNTARKAAAPKDRRRGVTTGRDLTEVYFASLVSTAKEADSIQKLFDAHLLTGEQATEAAVKSVSAPRILHIATHGFFLQDAGKETAEQAQAATRGIKSSAKIENPLLRSGLALAGANTRSGGAGEDGILTALEASGLNLWGTKLVTLSACDTGVGEVRNGEGVYGLRRALVLAGAESLVMSLWPVSDYITRELMTNYYKKLREGAGRGSALRQVQLEMLRSKERQRPFYWASFIQSGEWANLNGKR
ncbi:MAG TPA: CHAT domain-containing protein [Pyrinomonadaceae bacterium]|nr:CHAT domain-containing protein [Pyrinomonadaceae bacterium]